ncbi:hypothetical protein HNY73_016769 [Argiope bruennichi]|uniref:Ig-like domain-containing protein n=2 Tax=Argiope bruennichi TaxID=94029 RepID=A0A8T0EJU3_ARGBR|nr:hypothetical protein HNY73_016769 [Argiope bruennichi]
MISEVHLDPCTIRMTPDPICDLECTYKVQLAFEDEKSVYNLHDMGIHAVIGTLKGKEGVLCLRLVSLHVPSKVIVGDVIKLTCRYDLEGDTLYSIKWYRDDVEFFRFVPRDKPPGQFFPLQGVTVDLVRSANGTVYMQDTDVTTTGTYKCEVSADAPSFQTVSAQQRLTVREFAQDSADKGRLRRSVLVASGFLIAFLW